MTKEELKKEAIQYAVDYPTSYGKGYKHKDLRVAYLAGAEPREKKIAELEAQIEKMKCCQNCRWDTPSSFCDECTRFRGPISPEAIDNWELRNDD